MTIKTYTEDDIIKATRKAYKHLSKVINNQKKLSQDEKFLLDKQSIIALYHLLHVLGLDK